MDEIYSFAPASKKQEWFLNSEAHIIIYGGAMGGGKSYMGLLRHLRWVDDPEYRGFIIRKNSTTLNKSGGLFDEAKKLYKAFEPKVKINIKDMRFTFPSGAEIAMSHLETDEDAEKYRGLQISAAMIDEATQISEEHTLVVLSRLRTKADMVPNLFLTCNPNPDSFIRKWIDWWIIPEGKENAGRPDPKRDGKIRWFVRIDNEMHWGNSEKELIKKYGKEVRPLSVQFISANIYDNPPLIKANPNYLATLLGLKRIKKERDLFGNWDIREEAAGFFKRDWCHELIEPPQRHEIAKVVRAYDIAGSLKSETTPNPDYTASVKMALLKTGEYVILEVCRLRGRYGQIEKHILDNAARDGSEVDIIIPSDPNASGKAAAQMLVRKIAEHGYYARTRPTNKSKIDRFRPFASAAEAESIMVVKNCGNDLENGIYSNNNFFYDELEAFDGSRGKKDDIVDCCSDAFMTLAQAKVIPNFLKGLQSADFKIHNAFNR